VPFEHQYCVRTAKNCAQITISLQSNIMSCFDLFRLYKIANQIIIMWPWYVSKRSACTVITNIEPSIISSTANIEIWCHYLRLTQAFITNFLFFILFVFKSVAWKLLLLTKLILLWRIWPKLKHVSEYICKIQEHLKISISLIVC